MKILGLNAGEFNTSASILIKGEITAAVQEERFTRNKFTKEFPYNSIRYCLAEEKLKISDLDAISFDESSAHMTSYNEFSKTEFCVKITFMQCQTIYLIFLRGMLVILL